MVDKQKNARSKSGGKLDLGLISKIEERIKAYGSKKKSADPYHKVA